MQNQTPSLPPHRPKASWSTTPESSSSTVGDEPEGIEAVHDQLDRLRPLLRRMRRNYKWGLLGVVLATLLVGGYASFMFTPPYQSETVVFYQPDISPESLGKQAGRVDPTYLHELVFRRGRLEALLEDLNLHQDTIAEHGLDAAVEEVKQRIDFKPVGKSTFRLSYIGDSPEEARDITAWIANQVVDEELNRRRQQAKESLEFLDEELERTTSELAEHEERLGAFIAKHPRFATTNNEAAREAKLSGATNGTQGQGAGSTGNKRYVLRRIRKPADGSAPQPAVAAAPDPKLVAARQKALEELTRASQDLARLEQSYTEAHPDVRSAAGRVARAEAAVSQATEAVNASTARQLYNTAAESDDTDSKSAAETVTVRVPVPASKPDEEAEAEGGAAAKAPSLAELEKLPPDELGDVETRWMRLQRAVEEARDQQARLAAESFRAEVQSRSQSAGHSARAVILDPAYLPTKPMRSRLFFGKIWAPLALFLGLAFLIARALFDDRILVPDDASNGKMMLAVIPTHDRTA